MADTVYKLQQRVDQYSTEASVYQEGGNRINIEIPGVSDANAILEELGKPGSLTFQLEDGTVVLDGNQVESAEAGVQNDSMGNSQHVVSLSFTEEGAKAFAEATAENVGNPIYIVYDGEVISYPTVEEAITDGKCVISGSFTAESLPIWPPPSGSVPFPWNWRRFAPTWWEPSWESRLFPPA